MPRLANLGGRIIGEGKPVYIVAEGGLTNWGDLAIAKRQVDAAMAAGADAIKFQAQTTEALVSKKVDPRWYERLKYKELSYDALRELKAYCDVRNIDFFATTHTDVDLDFLDKDLRLPFFKIGSGESINDLFLKNVASRGKPVILSLGLHQTEEEIIRSVRVFELAGIKDIVILHCNTVYPTPVAMSDLRAIERLKNLFPSYPIGYSDHTVGWHVPLAAVALGAQMIEKHLSFDKTDKRSLDCPGSCTPEDQKLMVAQIREIEQAIGAPPESKTALIEHARMWAAQSAVAAEELPEGTVLAMAHVALKRPGIGVRAEKLNTILGKQTIRRLEKDELIQPSDVK